MGCAALVAAAKGIDLVDEDGGRRILPRQIENTVDVAGIEQFAAGGRDKGKVCLAGEGAGQHGLAGAGRPPEQHAARGFDIPAGQSTRRLQQADDLLQAALGLGMPGDVGKALLRKVNGESADTAEIASVGDALWLAALDRDDRVAIFSDNGPRVAGQRPVLAKQVTQRVFAKFRKRPAQIDFCRLGEVNRECPRAGAACSSTGPR